MDIRTKLIAGGEMTNLEKEELAARIRAMSEEEVMIVLENIPVELCLERIAKELDRAKAIEKSLKDVMATIS